MSLSPELPAFEVKLGVRHETQLSAFVWVLYLSSMYFPFSQGEQKAVPACVEYLPEGQKVQASVMLVPLESLSC